MGLTIYDLKMSFVWQKIHAHRFTPEEADSFCEQVNGRWLKHPSATFCGVPVTLVSNTARCFVMNFQNYPIHTNERKPRKSTLHPRRRTSARA